MPSKCSNPFAADYEPELDESEILTADLASWYASLIGMLRWMVEIGRVDIITEVSLMASHMAMPREGHLDAVLHIFGFLKIKYNTTHGCVSIRLFHFVIREHSRSVIRSNSMEMSRRLSRVMRLSRMAIRFI